MENPLAGLSQSNLVFTRPEKLRNFGNPAGFGGPLMKDDMEKGDVSEPFLVNGFKHATLHLSHGNGSDRTFTLETAPAGTGDWREYKQVTVGRSGYAYEVLTDLSSMQWIRIRAGDEVEGVTAYVHLTTPNRSRDSELIKPLPRAGSDGPRTRGVIRPRGTNEDVPPMQLHFAADHVNEQGEVVGQSYYEMDGDLVLDRVDDPDTAKWLREHAETKQHFTVDDASVVITAPDGERFRLPRTHETYDEPTTSGPRQDVREVVTERGLMNVHGTFYELPQKKNHPDPYLMFGYDRKQLTLSHDLGRPVTYTVEVDVTATDTWYPFREITVPPGDEKKYEFPEGYSAHWVVSVRTRAVRQPPCLNTVDAQ